MFSGNHKKNDHYRKNDDGPTDPFNADIIGSAESGGDPSAYLYEKIFESHINVVKEDLMVQDLFAGMIHHK